ncbi:complex I NDUFA9 subunit family protein [Thiohalocapsa marina]|uniref:Complex I NDUFA9 subunit family protein n=1 Tax=Thiohalocapsa marina TaxID=424902 RepID=A0A5M8FFV1_9GAMM|nr:complex I NDUFA9 subunit family protein [Thiohalocapsa marina]KAA6183579.1 complex I NDUFA9 subunit family protein [Thiohalocapsa marina]
MKQQSACILGGTGFVGRHLFRHLNSAGYHCIVPTRRPHRHRDLALYPGVDLHPLDSLGREGLGACFEHCDLVINLVGILNEAGSTSFRRAHVELVRTILAAMQDAGVSRLLHMSALNADAAQGRSAYLRSKGEGEDLAHAAGDGPADGGLAVTSFRPSVIFGQGDSFFNRFADLLQLAPGVFPLACPEARFAPVWVGDVAEAMVRSIQREDTIGRRFDLCGPRVLTLEALVEYTAQRIGKRVLLAGLNDWGSRTQARLFERLPGKPFTRDNYLSMQTPSVCGERNGLLELGIHPTDIETVVPLYLGAQN